MHAKDAIIIHDNFISCMPTTKSGCGYTILILSSADQANKIIHDCLMYMHVYDVVTKVDILAVLNQTKGIGCFLSANTPVIFPSNYK